MLEEAELRFSPRQFEPIALDPLILREITRNMRAVTAESIAILQPVP